MNDFITDLFNIDRKKIKKMNVVTSKDKTEFHIVLNHDGDLFCPFCYGVVHANGYFITIVINATNACVLSLGKILSLFLTLEILIFLLKTL